MNQFLAIDAVAERCFKSYKYKAIIILVLLIPFVAFEVSYSFLKHHEPVFSTLYAIFAAAFYGLVIFTAYNGIMRINTIIKKIQVTGSDIMIETFAASMLFNLIKKEPQVFSAQKNQIACTLLTSKNIFGRQYTGDIYSLKYAGDEYLIAEKFFERFSEVKGILENINNEGTN